MQCKGIFGLRSLYVNSNSKEFDIGNFSIKLKYSACTIDMISIIIWLDAYSALLSK